MDRLPLPPSLEDALIPSLPPTAYYIPNFITRTEEASLLHHINTAPLPQWRILSHRRLQAYPSILSPSNTLLDALLPPWLSHLIIPRLLSLTSLPSLKGGGKGDHIFANTPHRAPNQCLVNEYKPGQGIHSHEDGGAYAGVVCTVSLGASVVLDVVEKGGGGNGEGHGKRAGEGKRWRVLQEPRSLLVTTDEVYTRCLHGIEGVMVDEGLDAEGIANWDLLGERELYETGRRERETRVSLTFRDVLKVKKVGRALDGWVR